LPPSTGDNAARGSAPPRGRLADSYAGTRLAASIPPGLLLSLFAGPMLAAAAAIARSQPAWAGVTADGSRCRAVGHLGHRPRPLAPGPGRPQAEDMKGIVIPERPAPGSGLRY